MVGSYRWVRNAIISILLKKGWFSCVRVSLKLGEYHIYLAQPPLQSLQSSWAFTVRLLWNVLWTFVFLVVSPEDFLMADFTYSLLLFALCSSLKTFTLTIFLLQIILISFTLLPYSVFNFVPCIFLKLFFSNFSALLLTHILSHIYYY